MDDTTDKVVSPDGSTAPEGEALSDKDLGQETMTTGESQDGSDASHDAPQAESGPEGETTEETDEDAPSEDEDGDQDGSLLTPEQIAKLPKELKAQYRSMNTRFQQKMRELKEREASMASKPEDAPSEEPADKPVFIDRARLAQAKSQDEIVAVLEDGVLKAAEYVASKKAAEAVQPFEQERAAAQVRGYFDKYPDRAKYRVAMGKLDAKTQGSMSLDELYYAVAGANIAKTAEARKSAALKDQAQGNSETATGTTGGAGGKDIFDEIADAGGHGNSILL